VPVWDEAVLVTQYGKAGKPRVDQPQTLLARSEIVNVEIAGEYLTGGM
jgi:hypothetical protein